MADLRYRRSCGALWLSCAALATLARMSSDATADQAEAWIADDSTFGARLALIRQKMGWGNIAKAAKEVGVPTDSWRNWEVDGREPHRMPTIAMAIATRVGCAYRWLVHGPGRGDDVSTAPTPPIERSNERYVEARVLRTGRMIGHASADQPARQARPTERLSRHLRTPVAG